MSDLLKFDLSVDDLNVILEGLGELPAKRSHKVIVNLQKQALEHLNKKPAPEANPNG